MSSHTKLARIWALFIISGLTLVALALWRAPRAVKAAGTTFTVTNTNDSGGGSLRQAILDANANPGADTIAFNIGSGFQTISFSSKLPDITDAVTINGATQPGYSGTPLIRLDGGSNSNFGKFNALTITSGNSTVKSLAIVNYKDDGTGTGYGIVLSGSGGNIIKGCYFGVDVDGVTKKANAKGGILINGSATNIIGGTTAAERNVISGNSSNGIEITGSGATGNSVAGNYIGTTAAGTVFRGNFGTGIVITDAPNNTIGGTTGTTPGGACTGACNLISGSVGSAVQISATGATGNQVLGNFIGTDVNGMAAPFMGNEHGVSILRGAGGTTVGGAAPGARNIISGSNQEGVYVSGTNNLVAGNYVGIDTTGNSKIPNKGNGVIINNGPGPSSNNTIGGTVAGARNVISGNGGNGIQISGSSVDVVMANVIAGNYIGVNAAGTGVLGNVNDGIFVAFSGNNTIGGRAGTSFQGPCTGACNVISGNGAIGVELNGTLTTGTLVQGNYVGTDVSGTSALGNGSDGIALVFGANNNVIGNSSDNTSTPLASTEEAHCTSGPSATTAITYDKCMQEGGLIFKWNSITGEFSFIKCLNDGSTITDFGQGAVDNSHTFLNIISGKDFNGNDFKAEIDGYNMRGSLLKLLPIGGVTKFITDLNTSKTECECGRPQLISSNIGYGIRVDTGDNIKVRQDIIGSGVNGESLPNGKSAIFNLQGFNNHDDENSIECAPTIPCVDHQSGTGVTFRGNSFVTTGSQAPVSQSPGANNNQAPPVPSDCRQINTLNVQCTETVTCTPNTQCTTETYIKAAGGSPFSQVSAKAMTADSTGQSAAAIVPANGAGFRRISTATVTTDSTGHATVTAIFDPGPNFSFTTGQIAATTTDPTNGTSVFSSPVSATPSSIVTDLALTMTGAPNPAINSNITYTVGVTNNGPAAATNTVVIDILPLAVNFISATSTAGNCTADVNNIVTCNLASLANGGSAMITIVVAPTATGTFSNFAGVFSDITDNNRTNNGLFVETVVNSPSATPTPTPSVTPTPTPTVSIIVQTNAAGRSFTVDGTTYTAAQNFTWNSGSLHTLATTTPQQTSGARYDWSSWSDGGAISHSVLPSVPTTYTANFAVTPTSATVTISGRVLTSDFRGLRNTTVSMTDANSAIRRATTSSFGFFSFGEVPNGAQYVFRIGSRLFRFSPQTVFVNDDLTLPDFVGLE